MSNLTTLILTYGWLVLSGFGVFLTATMIVLTKSDLRFLKEYGVNGAVEAATRLAFWQSMRAFIILFALFAIGIISLLTPHVPSTREQPAAGPYNWAFIAFMYLVVITLDASTFAVYRFRRRWLRGRIEMERVDDLETTKGGV